MYVIFINVLNHFSLMQASKRIVANSFVWLLLGLGYI